MFHPNECGSLPFPWLVYLADKERAFSHQLACRCLFAEHKAEFAFPLLICGEGAASPICPGYMLTRPVLHTYRRCLKGLFAIVFYTLSGWYTIKRDPQ